jgi:hypothetical protein
MAKKTTPSTENEVVQAVDQIIEATIESTPEESPAETNLPEGGPVQVGYHSRDFGRTPKQYEIVVEQPSEPAQDGGQEEAEVQ